MPNRPSELTLRSIFPQLKDEELDKVEDVFYGYLEIVSQIYREAGRTHPERFDREVPSS